MLQMFVAHRYASHKWPIFLNSMILKHFYFISDSFYEDFPDPALMKNKEEGHGRPCFLDIQDDNGLYWMIPISSKVEKFKAIYQHKTQNGKRCDTIYFANILEIAGALKNKQNHSKRSLNPYLNNATNGISKGRFYLFTFKHFLVFFKTLISLVR